MSLIIFNKGKKVCEGYIPEPLTKSVLVPLENLMVQADGDELDYIRNRFDNLPITKGSICQWRGELAIFIVTNL